MPTAYITHPSFLLHDMGPFHPECPDRLHAIGDRLISAGLDAYLRHYPAPAATGDQIGRVHGRGYVETIEAESPTSGLHFLDPDTAMNAHSLTAARHAAGAVVLATDLVLRGECKTAFCAVRPPGHHAERNRAMGFCLFNNVAVGAAHALYHHRVERLAIVDFDVHHGNGTEDIFSGDDRVLMVSTFQHPLYPYSGFDNPAANMVNIPLAAGTGSDGFREAVRAHWLPALERHRPEIVYISAGFDAHREDPLAGLKLTEADYAWVTRELIAVAAKHAHGRIVSTLEGGYELSALGRSVAEHVRELLSRPDPGLERRQFLGGCMALSGAAGLPVLPAWANAAPRLYDRARLVTATGAPLMSRALVAETNYVFHFPYAGTPCFLLNLGRPVGAPVTLRREDGATYAWQGGVGPLRAIVAFSAICAHKLAYPTRDVSFIRYQPQSSATSNAHVIHCCADHSVYDPASGARVLSGPAPQPLAAILLDYDAATDELAAIGTVGAEQFAAFFAKYEFKLALEHGQGRARRTVGATAVVRELAQYCKQTIQC